MSEMRFAEIRQELQKKLIIVEKTKEHINFMLRKYNTDLELIESDEEQINNMIYIIDELSSLSE